MRCKESQVSSPNSWRYAQCQNKAVTGAGYCRVHDPELRAARQAKRPPTKWERINKARRELEEVLETLPPDVAVRISELVWVIQS